MKLQWCRLTADQHQNLMVLYAGLKIACFLSPPSFLQDYFKPRTFRGLVYQSSHQDESTQKKKAALPLS